MRKSTIKHEYLRKTMNEIMSLGDDITEEICERFANELKYSCLIAAGDIRDGTINLVTANSELGSFGLLFTDMDEFQKVFPDFDVGSNENLFGAYKELLSKSDLTGFILNFESEGYILLKEFVEMIDDIPESLFTTSNSYTSGEIKRLKNSINNSTLESFIRNPDNLYDYEGLFRNISNSTLFTLLVSRENLNEKAEDGVISTPNPNPKVGIYIENNGGRFATAYTSEQKISNVKTDLNKFSQIINFAYLSNFALSDDLDGVIINPNSDNIVLSRDVLMDYSNVIDGVCNNEKLNSGIFHMFLMEGEA